MGERRDRSEAFSIGVALFPRRRRDTPSCFPQEETAVCGCTAAYVCAHGPREPSRTVRAVPSRACEDGVTGSDIGRTQLLLCRSLILYVGTAFPFAERICFMIIGWPERDSDGSQPQLVNSRR